MGSSTRACRGDEYGGRRRLGSRSRHGHGHGRCRAAEGRLPARERGGERRRVPRERGRRRPRHWLATSDGTSSLRTQLGHLLQMDKELVDMAAQLEEDRPDQKGGEGATPTKGGPQVSLGSMPAVPPSALPGRSPRLTSTLWPMPRSPPLRPWRTATRASTPLTCRLHGDVPSGRWGRQLAQPDRFVWVDFLR